jgi:phosphate transport system ATP-binding protein
MSIFDNVAAGLRLDRVKGAELHERVERSLRRADLWDEVEERLSAPAIRLSGGQQQRLCIARTIAVEPAVILIAELKESFTIVIVTHNLQQAARVADTTAFVLAGELVEHAPTTTMFTTPSDPRTEQYVTGKFG